jgi:hypothetical protein
MTEGPGSYPSYPQQPGGGYGPPGVQRPAPPQKVMRAFYLMLAGAAVQALGIIVSLVEIDTIRSEIREAALKDDPSATKDYIDGLVAVSIGAAVVVGLISAGLWVWMAFMNRGGRNWARITATVFFGISTLGTLFSLVTLAADSAGTSGFNSGGNTVAGFLVTLVLWIIGLVTMVLLWNRESGQYFKPQPHGH